MFSSKFVDTLGLEIIGNISEKDFAGDIVNSGALDTTIIFPVQNEVSKNLKFFLVVKLELIEKLDCSGALSPQSLLTGGCISIDLNHNLVRDASQQKNRFFPNASSRICLSVSGNFSWK